MEWMKIIENGLELLSLNTLFGDINDILPNLEDHLKKYLNSPSCQDANLRCREDIFEFGVACLQVFIVENWTGPTLHDGSNSDQLKFIFSKKFNELTASDLQCDGTTIHSLCRTSGLLWIAFVILVKMSDEFMKTQNLALWKVRCLTVYQEILEETSSSLYDNFLTVVEAECKHPSDMDRESLVQFHLGCAHLFLKCYGYHEAKEHLERARNVLGLEVSLTGSLGKRTKFQQNELPQMRLEVKLPENRETNEVTSIVKGAKELPKDVLLEDDTLLTHVKFNNDIDIPVLKPVEQAYILSSCILRQKTTPKDDLLIEEMLPYIRAVLENPQAWAIQYRALHLRSVFESSGKRTVERAMMQMQGLVDQFTNSNAMAESRTHFAQSVGVPPHWVLEATFARLLVSLGSIKSALEVFQRLEAWEDVILCYKQLGRHEKAENTIRQQLEKKETAKLWCLLGDVTGNDEFFEKAWEFSCHRNARSQKSLGFSNLRARKFKECIPYFQKSLELNSLQPQIWFSLGCAGIATGQLDLAQKAFQRYVTIDPDNHEAWNNLASVFIRTNQKKKAYKAIQEALKANFGSWQIWENFLVVTVDIGEFKDTIRAFHRLLELKKKEVDVEVLRILVHSVTSNIRDAAGQPASDLIPKMKELFGRITAQVTNNAEIWLLYGDLYFNTSETDRHEKALSFYMKAQRNCMQQPSWEKDETGVKKVIEIYTKILQATESIMNEKDDPTSRIVSSSRMAISNFLTRFQAVYPDGLSGESSSQSAEQLRVLEEAFNVFCSKLSL